MKNTTWLLPLFLVLFSVSVTGCGSDSGTSQIVSITQSDAGKSISLHQDQLLKVALQGNGSTGYTWSVDSGSESVITQQGDSQFAPNSTSTGSGGTYTFTFKPAATGTTPLNMNYQRPFESNVPPLETFDVTVVVD